MSEKNTKLNLPHYSGHNCKLNAKAIPKQDFERTLNKIKQEIKKFINNKKDKEEQHAGKNIKNNLK